MEKLARPLDKKIGVCQLQIGTCLSLQIGTWLEHLPTTEQQQGHLPFASAETEPCAAVPADPLREFRVE